MSEYKLARIAELEAERDQLKAENERLMLHYDKAMYELQFSRDGIEQLRGENEILTAMKGDQEGSFEKWVQALAEIDTLRKQLDEARELLEQSQISKSGYDWDAWERTVDAWLEANEAYGRLADGVPAAMAKYHKCKKQLDEALELLEGYRWKDIDINNFVEKANESP